MLTHFNQRGSAVYSDLEVVTGPEVSGRKNDQEALSSIEKTKLESAMARGVNKAIIVGNLGRDPEVRYSANGNAIANVTVATTDSWKDRQSGERRNEPNGIAWCFLIAWQKLLLNTLKRVPKCLSKDGSRPESGKIKTATSGGRLKLWRTRCKCWAPAAAEERRARHEMIRVLRQRRAAPVHQGSVIRNSMTIFRSKN